MKRKKIMKLAVDVSMTILLLFLMAYELVGQKSHEWLGIGIFFLFVLHHILNGGWIRNATKRKYTPFAIFQTALVLCVCLAMAGSMLSGVILSRHALAFLPIRGGHSFARNLHMISAYWGFAFLSLHLGLHWNAMMHMAGKFLKSPSAARAWALRGLGFLIAAYGAYAFVQRRIGRYMLLRDAFVFFDYEKPIWFFLADYMAVMGLFIWVSHYLSKEMRVFGKKEKRKEG